MDENQKSFFKKITSSNPCKYCIKLPVCYKECSDFRNYSDSFDLKYMIGLYTLANILISLIFIILFKINLILFLVCLSLYIIMTYILLIRLILENTNEWDDFKLYEKILMFIFSYVMITGFLFICLLDKEFISKKLDFCKIHDKLLYRQNKKLNQ